MLKSWMIRSRISSRRLGRAALGVFFVGALAGCNADEPSFNPQDPLRQVDIPADFTFAMSRGVRMQVRADTSLAEHAPLQVQVSLPSGGRLYRGPIEPGVPKPIEVLAPRSTEELVIDLLGHDKTLETRVAVSGPVLEVELR